MVSSSPLSSSFTSNQWVHLAITVDSSNIVFYQDGSNIGNHSVDFDLSASDLLVGSSYSMNKSLLGRVDNVQVFDEALSASNVTNLYDEFFDNTIPMNEWSHVVASYNSNDEKIKMYLNGKHTRTYTNYTPTISNNDSPIVIGNNFSGGLADVIVYERPMLTADVEYLATNTNRFLTSKNLFYFNFQDLSVTDKSSFGHTATLSSTPLTFTSGFMQGSKALVFDGSQTITVPVADTYSMNQMLFSAYIQISTTTTRQSIVKKDSEIEIYIDTSGNLQLEVSSVAINPTSVISINTYTHVAMVIDKYDSKIKIFVDGRNVFTHDDQLVDITATTNDITIGEGFTGSMTEISMDVGYYKTDDLLTRSYIEYTAARVIANYTFDESGGNIVVDKSDYKNSGIMYNNPVRVKGTYDVQSKGLQFVATSNQYVEISGTQYENIDLNTITISSWVNTEQTGSVRNIVSKSNCFDWGVNATGNVFFNTTTAPIASVSNNTWTHLATTVDEFNSQLEFYVNGVKTDTVSSVNINIPNTDTNIYVGSNVTCVLDNVMIHHGVLPEASIQALAAVPDVHYTPSKIAPNTWSHVAAVYNKDINMVCTYTDGVYNGCYENYLLDFNKIGVNSNNMYIATTGDQRAYFDGIMDDVRVYNKALTHDDIKELHNMYLSNEELLTGEFTPTLTDDNVNFGDITIQEPDNMMAGETINYYAFALLSDTLSGVEDIKAFVKNKLTTVTHQDTTLTTTGTTNSTTWSPSPVLSVVYDTASKTEIEVSKINTAYAYVVGITQDDKVYYFKKGINNFANGHTRVTLDSSDISSTNINVNFNVFNPVYDIDKIYVAAFDYNVNLGSDIEFFNFIVENQSTNAVNLDTSSKTKNNVHSLSKSITHIFSDASGATSAIAFDTLYVIRIYAVDSSYTDIAGQQVLPQSIGIGTDVFNRPSERILDKMRQNIVNFDTEMNLNANINLNVHVYQGRNVFSFSKTDETFVEPVFRNTTDSQTAVLILPRRSNDTNVTIYTQDMQYWGDTSTSTSTRSYILIRESGFRNIVIASNSIQIPDDFFNNLRPNTYSWNYDTIITASRDLNDSGGSWTYRYCLSYFDFDNNQYRHLYFTNQSTNKIFPMITNDFVHGNVGVPVNEIKTLILDYYFLNSGFSSQSDMEEYNISILNQLQPALFPIKWMDFTNGSTVYDTSSIYSIQKEGSLATNSTILSSAIRYGSAGDGNSPDTYIIQTQVLSSSYITKFTLITNMMVRSAGYDSANTNKNNLVSIGREQYQDVAVNFDKIDSNKNPIIYISSYGDTMIDVSLETTLRIDIEFWLVLVVDFDSYQDFKLYMRYKKEGEDTTWTYIGSANAPPNHNRHLGNGVTNIGKHSSLPSHALHRDNTELRHLIIYKDAALTFDQIENEDWNN